MQDERAHTFLDERIIVGVRQACAELFQVRSVIYY